MKYDISEYDATTLGFEIQDDIETLLDMCEDKVSQIVKLLSLANDIMEKANDIIGFYQIDIEQSAYGMPSMSRAIVSDYLQSVKNNTNATIEILEEIK